MNLAELERMLDPERCLRYVRRRVSRDIRDLAVWTAQKYSSGPWSLAALARAGHPYRVGGAGILDPGIINDQGGPFRSSWYVTPGDGPNTLLYLINTAPEADFMQGTKRMISRPIWEKITDDLHAPFSQAIMHAMEAYWRQ